MQPRADLNTSTTRFISEPQRKAFGLPRGTLRAALKGIVCLSLCLPAGCAGVGGRKQAVILPAAPSAKPAKSASIALPENPSDSTGHSTGDAPLPALHTEESSSRGTTAIAPSGPRQVELTSGLVIAPPADDSAPPAPTSSAPNSSTLRPVPEFTLPPAAEAEDKEIEKHDPLQERQPAAYTLNLGDVIALADEQNPNVILARERINEAYALVERAEVLWVPSIRSGLNFNHHEGNVQDVAGRILDVSKSSWYGGLGAAGVGSNSPVLPGVIAQFHLTDAIFQPRIARHQASSRQFGAAAVRNDTLRSTALAYLELVRAEHALMISLEAYNNTEKLVNVTEQFAKTGQGLQSDYERMLAELAIRRTEVISREEAAHVASARLAQLLHADPSVPILSNEPAIVALPMMDHSLPAKSYVVTGLSRRPELAEQQQLVCEAVERLNREKYAPLIPSIVMGMSYGGFGGGTGGTLADSAGRLDMDAMAYWEVRNLGFGEQAARNAMSSGVRQARQRQLAILDQVAREVVETHAQVVERERRIDVAKQGVAAAETSYRLNLQRIENIQGLPIESLQAVQALANARQTYLNAVVDYNIAQIEFVRATGWFETR